MSRNLRPLVRWLLFAAAALVPLAIAAFVVLRWERAPLHPIRFQIPLPSSTARAPVLSPDGRTLAMMAYGGKEGARPQLWLYSLESARWRLVFEGKTGGSTPFWSPDSRFVAFSADGALTRVDAEGGAARALGDLAADASGGCWSGDAIVLSVGNVIVRMPPSGGTPVPVTALARGDVAHLLPAFLPDGRRFLYLRVASADDRSGIYVGSIDAAPAEGPAERLVSTRTGAFYAAGPGREPGRLLFERDGTLLAQAFDPDKLELTGDPSPVVERVALDPSASGHAAFASVSGAGALAFRQARPEAGSLVWVGRNGREDGPVVGDHLETPRHPRLSPDGRRLAVIAGGDLWVYDLAGRLPVQLTFDGASHHPVWTPDARRLIYATDASPARLLSVPSYPSDEPPQPVTPRGRYRPHGWSADGHDLIVTRESPAPTGWDLLALSLPTGRAEPLAQSASAEGLAGAAISPDGRRLAYASDVTGRAEIWVRPYPGPGDPVLVSANGGVDPRWSSDGREVYYLQRGSVMAVATRPGSPIDFRRPMHLFDAPETRSGEGDASYDVAADGRFVMVKRLDAQPPAGPVTVVVNWH